MSERLLKRKEQNTVHETWRKKFRNKNCVCNVLREPGTMRK